MEARHGSLAPLFREARTSWERSLPVRDDDRNPVSRSWTGADDDPETGSRVARHLLRTEPGSGADTGPGAVWSLGGAFALPREPDPFDPLSPPAPPSWPASARVLEVPADRFFRTGRSGATDPAAPGGAQPDGWVAVEARDADLGLRTLSSLRQIGLASLAPIPEPGLPILVGLFAAGALLRRRRPGGR